MRGAEVCGCESRGCHCTLAALSESAVRGAEVCGCELKGCHCTLAALSESAVRGAEVCGCESRGCHCTLAALSESTVRRASAIDVAGPPLRLPRVRSKGRGPAIARVRIARRYHDQPAPNCCRIDRRRPVIGEDPPSRSGLGSSLRDESNPLPYGPDGCPVPGGALPHQTYRCGWHRSPPLRAEIDDDCARASENPCRLHCTLAQSRERAVAPSTPATKLPYCPAPDA